jgi:hypothetical protein
MTAFFPASLLDQIEAARPRTRLSETLITELVAKWQRHLNLGDWDIRYDPQVETDPGTWATIENRYPEKVAVISLARDLPGQALELTIVHELVHLVLKPLEHLTSSLLAQVSDEKAQAVLSTLFEDDLEVVVEQLARACVPGAPRLTVGSEPKWRLWRLWKNG